MTAGGKKTVGVVGARGYVGAELLRLLAKHPGFSVDVVTSTQAEGKRVSDVIEGVELDLEFTAPDASAIAKRDLDVVFLGLPNGEAAPWSGALADARAIVIDLSSDHRFDPSWTYGQPERHRERIRAAKRIANPGCYATATQLAIDPIRDLGVGFVAFGVSGYSGAGSTPSPKNDPAVLKDNLLPYALTDHTHEHELRRQLEIDARFLPHVAPFFRGITVTTSFSFRARIAREALWARYTERYAHEALVVLSDDAPLVRDIAFSHEVRIGGLSLSENGLHGAVVSTIDNLLGGAATQALRNANLATAQDELAGIRS
ncbi:N-acetyl-gamma-glutamyl-phosphate reductase [soil metagenome]